MEAELLQLSIHCAKTEVVFLLLAASSDFHATVLAAGTLVPC